MIFWNHQRYLDKHPEIKKKVDRSPKSVWSEKYTVDQEKQTLDIDKKIPLDIYKNPTTKRPLNINLSTHTP